MMEMKPPLRTETYSKKKKRKKRKIVLGTFFTSIVILFVGIQLGVIFPNTKMYIVEAINNAEKVQIPNENEVLDNHLDKLHYTYNDYVANVEFTNEGQVIPLTQIDQTIVRAGQLDYFIQVPKGNFADGHFVSLSFSHSPILLENESTLTVLFDEKPQTSLFLSSKTENLYSLDIPISSELLTEGYHKISIIFNGQIDEYCADNSDPANWFTLHRNSFFYLNSTELTGDSIYKLEDFPYPYVQVGRENPINSYIVIPNEANEGTLKAAFKLSHALYKASQKAGNVEIVTESELFHKKEAKHIIAIGPHHEFAGIIKDILAEKGFVAPQEGGTVKTAWLNELQRQFLYIGTVDESINSFINVLTIPSLANQLAGEEITITDLPMARNSNGLDLPTLADLGVENILLTSAKKSSSSIYYEIPPQWDVTDSGILRLVLRVSPLVVETNEEKEKQEVLGLTININQNPFTISLKELVDKMDEQGFVYYDLTIPKEILMKNDVLELSFSVNFTDYEINCFRYDDSSRWVQINNTSYLDVPFIESDGSRLADWPAPFVDTQDLNGIAIVIPNEISERGLNQIVYLLNHLANQFYFIDHFEIIKESNYENQKTALSDYHFIVLKDHLDQDEQINQLFISETLSHIAKHEQSPLNENKVQITFQSSEQEEFLYFHPEMLSYIHSNDFASNIVVRSQSGFITTGDEQTQDSPAPAEEISKTSSISAFTIVLIAFFVTLIVVICLFIYFWKKRKKGNEEQE